MRTVEFRWTRTAKGAAHAVAAILKAQGYSADPQESPAEREPGLVYTNAHGRDVMAARAEVESSENPRSRPLGEVPRTSIYMVSVRGPRGETMYYKSGTPSRGSFNWTISVDDAKKFRTSAGAFEVYDYLMEVGVKDGTRIHHIIDTR